MKKHIIWSNLNIKADDWEEAYKEHFELNNEEIPEDYDESDVLDFAYDLNRDYLDDERYYNLNKQIEGKILVLGNIGRWNGRVDGYKIIGSGNIADILYDDCDYCEWYSDGYNIKFKGHHHDGTNYYEYRVIKNEDNIDNLLDAIYAGKPISRRKLNYYTRSLLPDIAKIYGW